jgi:tol-pal system protein YbgF
MSPVHRVLALALLPALAGCLATKRDLQDLQLRMDNDRAEQNRQIQQLITRTQAMLDSLSGQNARLRADVANRLLAVDRQLVQIQALGGQSQQQIRDLQRQLEQRAQEARDAQASADSAADAPAPERTAADTPRPTTTPERPATTPRRDDSGAVSPDEAYTTALGAFRRGSMQAARGGFQEFLRIAASDPRAAQAQYYIGETYTTDPDAAIAAYQRVVERWPASASAPAALLRIARLELARGDRTAARGHLNQIVRSYPRSDQAEEARTQLARLGTR